MQNDVDLKAMGGDSPHDWRECVGWAHDGCTTDGLVTFEDYVGIDGRDSSEDDYDLVLDDCRKKHSG